MVRREWVEKKNLRGKRGIQSCDRHFITSHGSERAKATARDVRNHWSVENKNHYRKDVSLWQEDDHRHRRINPAQNLGLMRSALLAIVPFDERQSLNDCLGLYDRQPHEAIKLIQKAMPI